jgi:four helix bundle suffix protein
MTYSPRIEKRSPVVAAYTIVCQIHQTLYLLDRQIRQLEQVLLAEGGLQRMTRARFEARREQR